MDGLLPPTWLEVSGCEGKRADLVEGIYTVRAKPLGNRTSYQKVADYEIPVVLWYNAQRESWTISIFQNVKEAQFARNILAMVNDSTEIPHKISSTWHVVDHDSSAVVACSELKVKKTDPILIRITGRRGANAHRINGTFVQRQEILGGKYSFKRQTDSGEEIILWYYKRKKCWMISWKGHVETENAYAVCKGSSDLPSDLDGGTWFVWISAQQSFATDNSIRVRLGGIRIKMESLNLAGDSSGSTSPQHTSPGSVTYENATKDEYITTRPPPVTKEMMSHISGGTPQVFIPPSTRSWDVDANTLVLDLLQDNDEDLSDLSEDDLSNLSSNDENHEEFHQKGTLFASMKDLTINKPVSPKSKSKKKKDKSSLRRKSVEIRNQFGFTSKDEEYVWSTDYLAASENSEGNDRSNDTPTKSLLDEWH